MVINEQLFLLHSLASQGIIENFNMMRRKIILLFIGLFMWFCGHTQKHPFCGTSTESLQMIQQRLIKNKAALKARGQQTTSRNREDIYIPLKFHLAARSNGTGRASGSDLLDQMCSLNETFKELGIQFYIKDGVNLIDNGAIYDSPTILNVETQMQNLRDEAAVNIFVVGNAQNPQREGVGRTLGFYDPRRDWIVVRSDQIDGGNVTLPHELGHFFSLPHPFNGWDFDPYSVSKFGSPAPETSPLGITTEFADGSNCETAGDRICDTPADYLYFTQIDGLNCVYREVMIDPQGDTLRPDPTLIMGYFPDRCSNRFTPMQVDLMKIDLEQPERLYLRNNDFTPDLSELASEPISADVISPVDDSTVGVTTSSEEITLEWASVEGASSYIVETTIRGFEAITTNEPQVKVPVEVGRVYRWKVKPFNDNNFCVPSSSLFTFTVSMVSSVPTITAVENWSIQPNPVNQTADLYLSLSASESFEADIFIRNVAGSTLMRMMKQPFSVGDNAVAIPTKELDPGLYILSLENEEGVTQRKVVVW